MPIPAVIEGRLASLSDAVIESGELTVTISDSVPIRTTSGEPVTAVAVGAQTNVSDTTQVTVATLTANGTNRLVQIVCSGTGYAKYQIYINSVLKETKRSGPDRNVVFLYDHPIDLNAGDVVDIKAIHYNTGVQEDFEATIYGFKYG
jgi:hypothetical protein